MRVAHSYQIDADIAEGWYFQSDISGSDALHGPYKTERWAELEGKQHEDRLKWGMTGGYRAHRASASWQANYDCNTEGMSADEKLKRWNRDGVAL